MLAFPSDATLARSLLRQAVARDTFPGLPRPSAPVLIAIAPDARRFRRWIGPDVPEWGAAVAFPASQRIVVQGSAAGAAAGDPTVTLRHELAHLALREHLGFAAPRWFDEGYASVAAGEGRRGDVLAANVALMLSPLPGFDRLSRWFLGGATQAQAAYALAHLAVEEHARLDAGRGLALFLDYWRETGSYERAVRRAYGVTSADVEAGWQRRVRLRYGVLAFLSDAAFAGVVIALLVGPVWWMRRQRTRRRLLALRAADREAERRARELEALLAAELVAAVGARDDASGPRGDEPPPGGG